VQRLAGALGVQVVDEVDDAAVVLEARREALAALVGEVDLETPGEEAISRKRCSSTVRS
jgi:hypothetical protein